MCSIIIYFSIYWEFHHPNWRIHIFKRGRYTTNQIAIFGREGWNTCDRTCKEPIPSGLDSSSTIPWCQNQYLQPFFWQYQYLLWCCSCNWITYRFRWFSFDYSYLLSFTPNCPQTNGVLMPSHPFIKPIFHPFQRWVAAPGCGMRSASRPSASGQDHIQRWWLVHPQLGLPRYMNWMLVGGDWNHGILWLSHHIGNFIIPLTPTDELIFFRGVGIPPTRMDLVRVYSDIVGILKNQRWLAIWYRVGTLDSLYIYIYIYIYTRRM